MNTISIKTKLLQERIFLQVMIDGYERFLCEESYDSFTLIETQQELNDLVARLNEVEEELSDFMAIVAC